MTVAACAPALRERATNAESRSVAVGLSATLGLAALAWVIAVRQMHAMDMRAATWSGAFVSFVALWTPMMAAMMLPAAAPVVVRLARTGARVREQLSFVGSYLVVWTIAGVAAFPVSLLHGAFAVGALVVATGAYELTPLKAHLRDRCRGPAASGFAYGWRCVGACFGLMLAGVVLGMASIPWMCAFAAVVLAQKLVPAKAAFDVPLALGLVGLGVVTAIAPPASAALMSALCGTAHATW